MRRHSRDGSRVTPYDSTPRWRSPAVLLAIVLAVGASPGVALAQLRIVSYNTGTGQSANPETGQTARAGMENVLDAIGQELTGGLAKPIDVLLLQEQFSMAVSAQSFVDLLNDLYDPVNRTMYDRSTLNALTSDPQGDAGGPGLVYNTQAVSLISEMRFGAVNGSAQARSTMRYQLRPVGYGSEADFYAYNNHYKADTGLENNARRLLEAQGVRANSDALGDGVHAIYAGDYNIQSTSSTAYQHLLSEGAGQAIDPLNPGNSFQSWNTNSTYASYHTQSPALVSRYSGQTTGGLDDRFDFQLVTSELMDGEGMSLIPGSYHAFGNNGTTYDDDLDDASNTYPFTGVSFTSYTRSQLLTNLASVTDHLPVVADYQLPAKLSAELASAVPGSVTLGAAVSLDVLVQNAASVLIAGGADELDYTLSVTGDLIGSAAGTDFALGGGNLHQVQLNTLTAGAKSGSIIVTSASQGAANALVAIPVSFTVGGGGTVVRQTIAGDDFDAPLNRISYEQSPAPGAFSSSADGFQAYQVGVGAVPPAVLRDDSASSVPNDTLGIVDTTTKTDAWFGVTDTINPDNPSGDATATWVFDVAGATGLEVSIDMGAVGDFESSNDAFNWTYSIDGAPLQPLFTSSINEAASQTYTFASGTMATYDDPVVMTPAGGDAVTLSNVLQTLTAQLTGIGDQLLLQLVASADGGDEGYVFDNIVVTGLVTIGTPGDFDGDGDVDAADLADWETSFGVDDGADADASGATTGADFLIWQRNHTGPQAATTAGQVPEPSAAWLALLAAGVGVVGRRCMFTHDARR